jgi:hypothetical protein
MPSGWGDANDACPFCDNAWDLDELRRHVQIKINHLKEVSRRREAAEMKVAPLVTLLRKVQSALDVLVRYGALARPPLLSIQAVRDYSTSCTVTAATLAAFLPLADTIAALAARRRCRSQSSMRAVWENAVSAPEPGS